MGIASCTVQQVPPSRDPNDCECGILIRIMQLNNLRLGYLARQYLKGEWQYQLAESTLSQHTNERAAVRRNNE